MKRIIFPALILMVLGFAACNSGKPNTDDPKAFAKWACDKSHEFVELGKEPVKNAEKMVTLASEMEAADREFQDKHKDNLKAAQAEMDAAFEEYCSDLKDLPTGY